MTTITSHEHSFDGTRGRISVHHWENPQPRFVVLLAHGYGEHAGRYEHVAQALVSAGGTVYAPDHIGHGRSDGEPALIHDIEDVVADLHAVAGLAEGEHPGLPTVLVGHSMGGIIATRYAQQHRDELAALVLSGPAIGGNPALIGLLELDPIPDVPIDPAILSNDPAVGEAYAADPLVYHGPFRRETLLAMGGAIEAIAAGPSLGDLPTLWIHGELDQLAPLEHATAAVDTIKGSALQSKVYPGAQHEIFNETNQDEVLADVVRFVGGVVG
jgi:alpha-beta hydrolase superfamily lysophospholipase